MADENRRVGQGPDERVKVVRPLRRVRWTGSCGQAGACTMWPAARYLSIQGCQLSGDNHSPWISTIGAVTFDIVSSVELRHGIEGGNAMSELPDWAQRLDLSPHPEGGWFRETWRSGLTIPQSSLPPDYAGPRSAGTAILFLLMPGQQSAWHTVRSTELWLYHRGSPLLLQFGAEQASAATHLLGGDITAGEQPQLVVPPATGSVPARATTSRHWSAASSCPDSTTPTSRWPLLPTEQLHRRRHQLGIARCRRAIGQQQGVLQADAGLHPAHRGVFQKGPTAFVDSRAAAPAPVSRPPTPHRAHRQRWRHHRRAPVRPSPACSARPSPTEPTTPPPRRERCRPRRRAPC